MKTDSANVRNQGAKKITANVFREGRVVAVNAAVIIARTLLVKVQIINFDFVYLLICTIWMYSFSINLLPE